MPAYTFVAKDLLNTAVLPDEPQDLTSYTTRTTSNIQVGPKLTRVTPSVPRNIYGPALDGAIDWRKETFIIGGMSAKWEMLKRKPGRTSGGAREWAWSGDRFTVKYDSSKNQWTAKSSSPIHPDDATFTIRKRRILKADDPAVIEFSQDVSPHDMLFLILVMIYSETKRQERRLKTAVAVAG